MPTLPPASHSVTFRHETPCSTHPIWSLRFPAAESPIKLINASNWLGASLDALDIVNDAIAPAVALAFLPLTQTLSETSNCADDGSERPMPALPELAIVKHFAAAAVLK